MTFPKRPLVIGAGAAVLLGLAFFLGRTTAPTRIHEVTVSAKADVKSDAKLDAKVESTKAQQSTAGSVATDQGIEWDETTVYRPNGTVRSHTRSVRKADSTKTSSETKSSQESAKAETHAASHSESHTEYVYRDKLIETARPNWSVGAHAGLGTDLTPRYGGEVGRRIVGGLWLTASVDVPTRAATLGIRFDF